MIYKIEQAPYGIRVTFDGMMDEDIAKEFAKEFLRVLAGVDGEMSILIDLRKGKPISGKSQEALNECYNAVVRKGLIRSANIVSSPVMKMQMMRRAKELGTYEKVRYVDSSGDDNCEQIALNWLERGIDPDK